ncbi:ankyrin repeat domain-containing protein [Flectobacillus major]|uniref:ankyrin repeat domain-containing protein n=1 Tax=Flectobacillus major TaxID=103 RepID=UPI00047EC750|nr:ankyrin repeat domain-containing protein [Flectobacillus major]
MKATILQIILSCLLFSCSNRDELVDKSNLTGNDYRLFQNTPAWELAKAVQDENEKKIIEIVTKNPQLINYQEPKFGSTLLMLTIKNQQYKAFEILLKNNANVNIYDTYEGSSALIEAASSKYYHVKFVEALLQHGANVNDVQKIKNEPDKIKSVLMKAAKTGNINLIKLLIEKGANLNYQNSYKQTALSEAVMRERYNIVLYLLENGADYKQPIFFRPAYGIHSDQQDSKDKGKSIYLVDMLREDFFELDTDEYKYKMQIVDFLKTKGIDYRTTPIPEYIKKKAQEEYPNSWQEYLEKY